MKSPNYDAVPEDEAYDIIATRISTDVLIHGFSVIGVAGTSKEEPSFNYTVGLFLQGLPELIVFGLPIVRGHIILHDALKAMLKEPKIMELKFWESNDIANMKTMLVDMPYDLAIKNHMVWKDNFSKEPCKVMQLVWPDVSGLYPWEDGCNSEMHKMQCGIIDLSFPNF